MHKEMKNEINNKAVANLLESCYKNYFFFFIKILVEKSEEMD